MADVQADKWADGDNCLPPDHSNIRAKTPSWPESHYMSHIILRQMNTQRRLSSDDQTSCARKLRQARSPVYRAPVEARRIHRRAARGYEVSALRDRAGWTRLTTFDADLKMGPQSSGCSETPSIFMLGGACHACRLLAKSKVPPDWHNPKVLAHADAKEFANSIPLRAHPNFSEF
jgi:hypothetical protein